MEFDHWQFHFSNTDPSQKGPQKEGVDITRIASPKMQHVGGGGGGCFPPATYNKRPQLEERRMVEDVDQVWEYVHTAVDHDQLVDAGFLFAMDHLVIKL